MMRRSIVIIALLLPAAPASALPCLWSPFSGCSFTFVSPEYAARPVQPLDKDKALQAVNAFRTANGLKPLVLDERLCQAAAMQSKAQAERSWIGHYGPDGSENVASGQKSFADALQFWEQSSGHRTNLLRANVTAIGVAMAKTKSGHPYWTLVLAGQ